MEKGIAAFGEVHEVHLVAVVAAGGRAGSLEARKVGPGRPRRGAIVSLACLPVEEKETAPNPGIIHGRVQREAVAQLIHYRFRAQTGKVRIMEEGPECAMNLVSSSRCGDSIYIQMTVMWSSVRAGRGCVLRPHPTLSISLACRARSSRIDVAGSRMTTPW